MAPRSLERLIPAALLATALLTTATPARAQEAGPAAMPEATQAAGGCDEENTDEAGSFRKITKGGEVIYEYTGVIRVCGKVPKPNVVAILLEKTIEYEWESLKKDFLPKIQDSVKRAPF